MGSWSGISFCCKLLGQYVVLREARQGQVDSGACGNHWARGGPLNPTFYKGRKKVGTARFVDKSFLWCLSVVEKLQASAFPEA